VILDWRSLLMTDLSASVTTVYILRTASFEDLGAHEALYNVNVRDVCSDVAHSIKVR
jgi:hypothetical protein